MVDRRERSSVDAGTAADFLLTIATPRPALADARV